MALPLIFAACGAIADVTGADFTFRMGMGNSMLPTLKTGDITIQEKDAKNVRVGDIINFKIDSPSIKIAHRVVAIIKQGSQSVFKTQGDNNESPDYFNVTTNQILGKVTGIIPTGFVMMPYILIPSVLLAPSVAISKLMKSKRESKLTQLPEHSIRNTTNILLMLIALISTTNAFFIILSFNV